MRRISGVFADENILPVGRKLAKLPEVGTVLYPGHEDIPELPLEAKDTEIFEEIGARRRNLLFITRDKKIRTRPAERQKPRDARVRAVFLTGRSNMTQDDIYQLIIKFWDELAAVDSRSGHAASPSRNAGSGRYPGPADTTTADPWALGAAVTGNLHDRRGVRL